MEFKSKFKSRHFSNAQECQVVRMYEAERTIKDISIATGIGRCTVTKILDAHEVRRPYKPAEAKKKKEEPQKGTIIQQCVAGASERHKRLNELFKPTMTA